MFDVELVADTSIKQCLWLVVQCCINNAELMFRLLLDSGADVNALDTENWSPLHAAAACGRVSFCEALCERFVYQLARRRM